MTSSSVTKCRRRREWLNRMRSVGIVRHDVINRNMMALLERRRRSKGTALSEMTSFCSSHRFRFGLIWKKLLFKRTYFCFVGEGMSPYCAGRSAGAFLQPQRRSGQLIFRFHKGPASPSQRVMASDHPLFDHQASRRWCVHRARWPVGEGDLQLDYIISLPIPAGGLAGGIAAAALESSPVAVHVPGHLVRHSRPLVGLHIKMY